MQLLAQCGAEPQATFAKSESCLMKQHVEKDQHEMPEVQHWIII